MSTGQGINSEDLRLLASQGIIEGDEKAQAILSGAKRNLFNLGFQKADRVAEALFTLQDRTLGQQLPDIQNPEAGNYLNEVLPQEIVALIEMIQDMDFTYIDGNGDPRVFGKDDASEFFVLIAGLAKIHRSFTFPQCLSVPGFEQHFAVRFSPFLCSLTELVKKASSLSEKRKIEKYQRRSSEMSLSDAFILHQTYSARLMYHQTSEKALDSVVTRYLPT